jgi:hypothetical protein
MDQGYLGYPRRAVAKHPGAAAVLMAVLVLLIVVLSFMIAHTRKTCSKSGFEGMASRGGAPCGPGETPVTYRNPDGTTMTYAPAAALHRRRVRLERRPLGPRPRGAHAPGRDSVKCEAPLAVGLPAQFFSERCPRTQLCGARGHSFAAPEDTALRRPRTQLCECVLWLARELSAPVYHIPELRLLRSCVS